jgi:hypothetical protein
MGRDLHQQQRIKKMNKLNDLDVRLWLGGRGNFHIDQCVDILVAISNGDYQADQLKQDILDYKDVLGDYLKNPYQDKEAV